MSGETMLDQTNNTKTKNAGISLAKGTSFYLQRHAKLSNIDNNRRNANEIKTSEGNIFKLFLPNVTLRDGGVGDLRVTCSLPAPS